MGWKRKYLCLPFLILFSYLCYFCFVGLNLNGRENVKRSDSEMETQILRISNSAKFNVSYSNALLSRRDSMAVIHSDLSYSSVVNNNTLYLLILPFSTKEQQIDRVLEDKDKRWCFFFVQGNNFTVQLVCNNKKAMKWKHLEISCWINLGVFLWKKCGAFTLGIQTL